MKNFSKHLLISVIFWLKLSEGFVKHCIQRTTVNNKRNILAQSAIRRSYLDEFTLWRINVKLQKPNSTSTDVALQVRFIESKGYEPPQGRIFIQDDYQGFIRTNDAGYSGIWSLSEDKDDRKDGLWVWGLFEEPKYPFLYFYLDVYNSTINASGNEEPLFDGKGFPSNRLDFRFSHSRDNQRGVILENGLMTYKDIEFVNADPLGIGGRVNVGESVSAGTVEIRPVFENS